MPQSSSPPARSSSSKKMSFLDEAVLDDDGQQDPSSHALKTNNAEYGNMDNASSDALGAWSQRTNGGTADSEERLLRAYRSLAKEETKTVRKLRLLVIAVLIIITAVVAVLIYLFVKNNETSEFEDEFEARGNKLVNGFRDDSFQKMQALESLSLSLTTYAVGDNATWPFVTVPKSHEFLSPYLSLANAASIKFFPLVSARQRWEWEAYAQENQGWVDEDIEKRLSEQADANNNNNDVRRSLQYFCETDEDNIVSPYIKNYVGIDTSHKYWLPWWQYTPVIANKWFVNFNQLADAQFKREIQPLLNSGKAVISATDTILPGLDFQSTKDFEFTEELLAAGGFGQYEPGEPIGYIYYPVFEDLEDRTTSGNTSPVAVTVLEDLLSRHSAR